MQKNFNFKMKFWNMRPLLFTFIISLIFTIQINASEHDCCNPDQWNEWSFDHNGCRVYVRERGQGIPVIVINRLGFDHSYMIDAFCPGPEFTRLVYYDPSIALRSTCNSDTEEVSIYSLAVELEELRKNLNSESIILISHSSGSLLAYEYMQHFPGHVKGLIAFAAWPASGFGDQILQENEIRKHESRRLNMRFTQNTEQKQFKNEPPPLSFKKLLEFSALNLHDPDRYWEKIRGFYHYDEKIESKLIKDLGYWDYMPVIVSDDHPVLFLLGKQDFMQPSWEGLKIDYLNHIRFEEFDNTGHIPWIESKNQVNRWIRPYIDLFISY